VIRIAKVIATGKKYLVINLDLNADRVHVWGEVTKTKGLRTWHGPNMVFMRSAVEISEVPKTQALLTELFDQAVEAVRASGREVTVRTSLRGNVNARVQPTAAQRAAQEAARASYHAQMQELRDAVRKAVGT